MGGKYCMVLFGNTILFSYQRTKRYMFCWLFAGVEWTDPNFLILSWNIS